MLAEKVYLKHYFLSGKEGALKYADDRTALQNLEPMKWWLHTVEDYTQRALTFETYGLLAMAGIVREVYAQTGLTYIAGIWTENIYQTSG